MNKNIIFIIGIHTSGKTSILKKLYKDGYIEFYGEEIGKKLFYECGRETINHNSDFEKKIFKQEIERDESLKKYKLSGIESWHPGNIAYILSRENDDIIDEVLNKLNESCILSKSFGIILDLDPKLIANRTSTFLGDLSNIIEFYNKISLNIDKAIKILKIEDQITRINANQNFDTVYKQVIEVINKNI